MCIGWCADQVTLRSARCYDKDDILHLLYNCNINPTDIFNGQNICWDLPPLKEVSPALTTPKCRRLLNVVLDYTPLASIKTRQYYLSAKLKPLNTCNMESFFGWFQMTGRLIFIRGSAICASGWIFGCIMLSRTKIFPLRFTWFYFHLYY